MGAISTNGMNKSIQIGKETTYGVKVSPTKAVIFLSEGFGQENEYGENESLIGSISATKKEINAYNCKGSLEGILYPYDAIPLFALALGVQATPVIIPASTGVHKHTFTPVDANTQLPSVSTHIDRGEHVYAYTGVTVKSFELSAASKKELRYKVDYGVQKQDMVGEVLTEFKDEAKEGEQAGSYKFGTGELQIDSVAVAGISSITLTVDEGYQDGDFTLGSGMYASQGTHGERKITLSADMKFNTFTNDLIEQHYYSGAKVSMKLKFITSTKIEGIYPHLIEITLPSVIIDGGLTNIAGKEDMKCTITGTALESTVSPITVVVHSDEATSF